MYSLLRFRELPSTNTYARQKIKELSDKTVIVSDTQTAGRGRFDRNWISDIPGNIYLSIVLKPADVKPDVISTLSHYTAIAICRVLEQYPVKPQIKWPNDILVNGQKIAGILAESSFMGQKFNGLVLGVGINLNMPQNFLQRINQPATSLNLLLEKPIDQEVFRLDFLDTFFEDYENYLKSGFKMIKNEYIKKSSFIGEKVNVKCGKVVKSGVAQSLTDNGELILLIENGTLEKISVGEIY